MIEEIKFKLNKNMTEELQNIVKKEYVTNITLDTVELRKFFDRLSNRDIIVYPNNEGGFNTPSMLSFCVNWLECRNKEFGVYTLEG